MSLENCEVIDAVGSEKDSNIIVLSIIDSWNWADEIKHLLMLQAKLNSYFGFVESGQIYDSYPDAIGKNFRLDIIFRHQIPESVLDFLKQASMVASALNLPIAYRVLRDEECFEKHTSINLH